MLPRKIWRRRRRNWMWARWWRRECEAQRCSALSTRAARLRKWKRRSGGLRRRSGRRSLRFTDFAPADFYTKTAGGAVSRKSALLRQKRARKVCAPALTERNFVE